jgi:uncharacterized phage protein gp47/JayE
MKSLSEIAFGLIANIHETLPDVDTKEGTFIRDVFIDPAAKEINDLYVEMKAIEIAQSILTASGDDLDKLAMNFFVERKQSTYAQGVIRFYIGIDRPTDTITIPQGTIVGTESSTYQQSLLFILDQTLTISPDSPSTYSFDSTTGQYYADVSATAESVGTDYNVSTGLVTQYTGHPKVISITNPFAFTGGSDAESDISLAMRVNLALTGSNIGTRDGYKSFILRQNDVVDAVVVGAAEPMMLRDGGHFNDSGEYVPGDGGMVDIFVRSEKSAEHSFDYEIDYNYTIDQTNSQAYADIKLIKQPVLNVYDIVSTIQDENTYATSTKTYINGSAYEVERGSGKYYKDMEWDTTPVVTINLDASELLQAEAKNILNKRLAEVDYLTEVRFDLQWNLINPINDVTMPQDLDFFRGYYSDGMVYLIQSKDYIDDEGYANIYVGGRYFLKKDGKIYERIYIKPDFILVKDTSDFTDEFQGNISGSVRANDVIRWLPNEDRSNLPGEGETLTIRYNWNRSIEDLQDRIEVKRVLTADVLIREAEKVGIEIKIEVAPYDGFDVNVIRDNITTRVTDFINNLKKLGGEVDRSDIVYIVRGTSGVEAVSLDNITLSITNGQPEKKIILTDRQYMELTKLAITFANVGEII